MATALYDEGLLDGGQPDKDLATARRDVLIGREQVPEGMRLLGLDDLPDLRFAQIVQELTRKGHAFNRLVRSQLGKTGLYLSHRNGPVVELGLRSYSASVETPKHLDSIRKALDTGCLWQDLVDTEWTVENAATDHAIDGLRDRAHANDTQAALVLGVLGVVALVVTGHLRAAAGSAEETVGTTIARTSVGQIIKGLLETGPGRELLADAVKRSRAHAAAALVGQRVQVPGRAAVGLGDLHLQRLPAPGGPARLHLRGGAQQPRRQGGREPHPVPGGGVHREGPADGPHRDARRERH